MKEQDGEKLVPKPVFKYKCNVCRRKLVRGDDEIIEVKHSFGYGSKHDMEAHELHICEECYFENIKTLAIPPTVREYIIGEGFGSDAIAMDKAVAIANIVNGLKKKTT